jgi:hypothetical protein
MRHVPFRASQLDARVVPPESRPMNREAEAARRRYLYRRLIVRGDLRLARAAALPLTGPDCAYHLYAWEKGEAPVRRHQDAGATPKEHP